jgi:hypothetical protein
MRRIQLVLGALAIVVTSFAAFSGPAMAQDNDYPPFYEDYPPFYNAPVNDDSPPFYDDSSPFYNDYPPFYNGDVYYDEEFYDEEFYEAVQEAQEEYREDLADIYEDSNWGWYSY